MSERYKKEKYVTRAFIETRVTALVVDTETAEVSNKPFILPGKYKDNAKILAKLRKDHESQQETVAAVVSVEEVEVLRGMLIADFIENSIELDPETRQSYEREIFKK